MIRHGNTDAVGDHLSGHAPHVHLNDSGRAQVAALVERLRPTRIDAVFSSPLERTRETAGAIARDRNVDVVVEPRLIEYDVGAWTGRTFAAMDPLPEWQRFNAVRSVSRPPGGELMLDVQQRAVEALLDIHRKHPDANVAAVSHGDVAGRRLRNGRMTDSMIVNSADGSEGRDGSRLIVRRRSASV